MNKTLVGIVSASAIGLASLGFSGCDTIPATYDPYPPVYQPAPVYRSPIIIERHHHPRNIYINPRPHIYHRPIPIHPLRPHRPIGPPPRHHPHGGPFR